MQKLDMLDPNKIAQYLPAARIERIQLVDQLKSTNDFLLNSLSEPLPNGQVIITEQQTAGRGQFQRQWYSPPAMNLYFSYFWQFQQLEPTIIEISNALAELIVQTLTEQGYKNLQIKQPNDIMYRQKKLAGILVETRIRAKHCKLVAGVGLNVNMVNAEEIDQPWTSMRLIKGEVIDRNKLIAQLLIAFDQWFAEFNS
jgi:BirA family biotin operon repressor/biotin-[acetyl-CoA-carboxylase] ligase